MRTLVLAALLASGCEHLKSPDRIEELDRRVDELSAAVSAMKGEPVGAGKKAEEHHEDGVAHAAKPPAEAEKDKKAPEPAAHAAAEPPPPPAPHEIHWTYDGESGPAKWGELKQEWVACGAGGKQSPIDIEPKKGKASPIEFSYHPTGASVVDNGHTLQVDLEPGSSIAIDGARYELVQFHVHTPSEHTIAGDQFPLEVHLVHKSAEGKLAVVGVLYDVGDASEPLGRVWKKWPAKQGQPKKLSGQFDPTSLLPETRAVYRYEGSLTTPPCSEGVVWNVMRRTRSESQANLDILHKHYKTNARPVVALGDREVQ